MSATPPDRHPLVQRSALLSLLLSISLATFGCDSPTRVTPRGNDSRPQCAIDRRYVAYEHIAGGPGDPRVSGVYVMHLDSLNARLVAAGAFTGFDWIPGQDSLIVSRDNAIYQLSIASGQGVLIATHEAFNTSVSPSGKYVAFDAAFASRSNVFLLSRATGVISNITPDSMLYQAPDWSPSDSELVVLGGTMSAAGIYRISPAGAPIRQLTVATGHERLPSWSPAGGQIAWVDVFSGGGLWVIDTSGANRRKLTTAYDGVSWESGGRALVYTVPTSSGVRLFEYDLNTGNKRQLTF